MKKNNIEENNKYRQGRSKKQYESTSTIVTGKRAMIFT